MALSRYEQETVIVYNQEESTATVFTHNQRLITQMARRGVKGEQQGQAMQYTVPKSWIAVRPPRNVELTDAQKAERGDRLRELHRQRAGA